MNRPTPKMLIVDDQQININLLKTQFHDYEVDEANSGRSALKKILQDKPDIILLDVMMPGIDGYSVLSIIKNSPETRFIPVILVTAIGGIEELVKSQQRGADDLITTPFKPAELRDKVKTLLQIKALHDELSGVQHVFISMAQTLEDKTEYFAGHAKRAAGYAVRLARKELVQPLWFEEIKVAAMLRDIGNLGIKDSILLKAAKLTDEEFRSVKEHPAASEKICSAIATLNTIRTFIRHHHERYDGGGYPDGLKGSDIPVGARIIAVADAYDALTSNRPYRRAYLPAEAMVIMRENAGTQWDPELVNLFCQMVDDGTLHGNE